jgi:hypothetical protein
MCKPKPSNNRDLKKRSNLKGEVGLVALLPLFSMKGGSFMGKIDWDVVTNFTDAVTTTLKTVTFPKVQEQVYLRNQGNANFTYTIGSQSGTLTPGQSVTVNQDVSSFTLQAVSGTHTFEVRAKEKGTEQIEIETDVVSQLAEKAKKTNGVYDFEKDFNGKVNDSNFDNSTALVNALTYLMANGGGQLNFGIGTFYFSTPINFTTFLSGIKLKGVTAYGNSRGTKLKYTGANYFLTFSDFEFSQVEDITIEGNGTNNGLFIGVCTVCDFTSVQFSNFATNLRLYNKSGYAKFHSCGFSSTSSTVESVILGYSEALTGTQSDNNIEYVYFDECNFEGNFLNATGIKIYFGQFIYFNECDICNWNGYGVSLSLPSTSHIINDLFFDNISFFRNKVHFKAETTVASAINRITLKGHFIQRDTVSVDDRFIVLNGNTNGNIISANITATILNTNENVMTYGMEMFYTNNYDINIFGRSGKISRTSSIGNIHQNSIRNSYAVLVPTSSTTYTWTLTGNSPFSYNPIILVSSMNTQNYTWNMSNTFGGNLTITLTFGSALASAA